MLSSYLNALLAKAAYQHGWSVQTCWGALLFGKKCTASVTSEEQASAPPSLILCSQRKKALSHPSQLVQMPLTPAVQSGLHYH